MGRRCDAPWLYVDSGGKEDHACGCIYIYIYIYPSCSSRRTQPLPLLHPPPALLRPANYLNYHRPRLNPQALQHTDGRALSQVYSPLSRPATSSGKREWLPVPTTARSTASMDFKRIPANPRCPPEPPA